MRFLGFFKSVPRVGGVDRGEGGVMFEDNFIRKLVDTKSEMVMNLKCHCFDCLDE